MPARRSTLMLMTLAALSILGSCSRAAAIEEPNAAVDRDEPNPAALDRRAAVSLALSLDLDDPRRPAVIDQLRERGPAGLDALIAEYQQSPERSVEQDEVWRALIDDVAQQRDAHYGGLFWYRDMNEARAAASTSGKPILSLRLLGELTSEYSCANSRLFRTLLYADPELATWLEGNFVLHWSSERPVPKLEIDFGDGRKLARTITGNSAHFVLDERGRTIDVIPGLLTASSFRSVLSDSLALHGELAKLGNDARWRSTLAEHHQRRFDVTTTQLGRTLAELRGIRPDVPAVREWLERSLNPGAAPVPAMKAVPMAVGKSRIEAPILAAAPGALGGPGGETAGVGPSDAELWQLGTMVAGQVELHENSLAIIAAERPLDGLVPADRREAAELALRTALVRSLQTDTAKNLYEMHARVHLELASRARDGLSLGFADVDEWLYAELFATPASDPWLGLVDPTVYTGLAAGGIMTDQSADQFEFAAL